MKISRVLVCVCCIFFLASSAFGLSQNAKDLITKLKEKIAASEPRVFVPSKKGGFSEQVKMLIAQIKAKIDAIELPKMKNAALIPFINPKKVVIPVTQKILKLKTEKK